MNCREVRRQWDLYHDSEGGEAMLFQLKEHLEKCPACTQWFDGQSRLTSLIEQRLAEELEGATDDLNQVDWPSILAGAGVTRVKPSRSWMLTSAVLIAVAASLWFTLGVVWDTWQNGDAPNLARLSAEVHHHVSSGGLRPDFESRSDIEVDQYLLNRVSFPVRCPPRKDSGFVVRGAGLCELAHQPAAYVVGFVDGHPVSIFVLPRESLSFFPVQRADLLQSAVNSTRQEDNEIVYSIIDQNVVLVVGNAAKDKLTRVLNSYGTYPHAS